METTSDWDVFISHASEDKEEVARPLARILEGRGFKVWLDAFELTVGDKLRQAIDKGLSRSRWGVVILSPYFFAKAWTQSELEGLIARETAGEKVVLPVWHRLSDRDVISHSPILAARIAANTSSGLESVADALTRAMRADSDAAPPREGPEDGRAKDLRERLAQLQSHPDGLEGSKLGQYALQKFVGSGGTGAVYRALNLPLGQTVCVKVFFPLKAGFEVVTKATERGIRGLAALRHPNVAPVLDYGFVSEAPGAAPYVVCGYVKGVHLDRWSRGLQGGESALKRRIGVAIKIALALSAAHSCSFIGSLGFQESGVFHGDVKPSNILVTDADEPVLLDFMMPDLQRLTDARAFRGSRWEKGADGRYQYGDAISSIYGTPGFMAPEQEVEGIVLPESDVFSLGRTFLRLFWPGMEEGNYMVALYGGHFKGAELDLSALTGQMTKPQPQDRITAMSAVANALGQISSRMR